MGFGPLPILNTRSCTLILKNFFPSFILPVLYYVTVRKILGTFQNNKTITEVLTWHFDYRIFFCPCLYVFYGTIVQELNTLRPITNSINFLPSISLLFISLSFGNAPILWEQSPFIFSTLLLVLPFDSYIIPI